MRDTQYKIINKSDSLLMKIVSNILFFNKKKFMDEMPTTFGNKVYVPTMWNSFSNKKRKAMLEHELVHIRQFKKFTIPGFLLLYLLLPLPLLLSWFRVKFEVEAYAVTLKHTPRGKHKKHLEHYVNEVCGPRYLWSWYNKEYVANAIKDEYFKLTNLRL